MNDFLKTTFDSQAEQYNEVRPRYPGELFDVLEKAAHLNPDSRLLEIAPGTGQATKPLAERGYSIVAVELGSELADVARRELRSFEKVQVVTSSFEDAELPLQSFDLVFCATAFHWISPETKFAKTHALLKDNGHLAIIYSHYVSSKEHDGFFVAAHAIFEKYDRNKTIANGKSPILPTDEVNEITVDQKLFKPVLFKTFPVTLQYSIDDYIKLICTFSFIIAMDHNDREGFLKEIRDLAVNEFQKTVTISLVMSLTLAKKV